MAQHACPSCSSSDRQPQFYGAPAHVRDLGGLRLLEVRHDAARDVPRHAHSTAFVSVLVSGRYQSRFGGTSQDFSPGRAVWHEDGFDHEDSIAAGGALFFCLEIESGRLSDLASWQGHLPASEALGLPASVSLLRLFIENRSDADPLVPESLSAEFFGAVVQADDTAKSPAWLERVRDRLCSDPGARASLSELSEVAGVHPCHLTRSFRAQFDCSVGEFARTVRLRRAWERLADSKTDIAELAYSFGYSDQAHFTREFRQMFSIPPARARRAIMM